MAMKSKRAARAQRRARIRSRVYGTAERPRLSVYRSNAEIYAQVIDDDRGHTVVAASSLEDDAVPETGEATKSDVARRVGELLAARAEEAGVTAVVFDRGGFRYAGRVRALAEGAREGGLDL